MKYILILIPSLLACTLSFSQNNNAPDTRREQPNNQEKQQINTTPDSTATDPRLKGKKIMPLRPGMTTPVEAPKEEKPAQQNPEKKED